MSARFLLLGGFRLEIAAVDSPQVLPRLRKTRSLLAYLLLSRGRTHSRDELATLLWGEFGEDRARDNLSTALAQIRPFLKSVGASLQADRFGISLELGAATLDVADLESGLAPDTSRETKLAALALYRGDLLADWLDEWIIVDRERLRRRVLDVGTTLLEQCLSERNWAAGIELGEKLSEVDPLDSRIQGLLMRLLLAANERERARRHYQQYMQLLKTQLEAEPVEALQQLYQQSLDDVLAPFTEAGKPLDMPAELRVQASDTAQIRLVGRSAEQAQLQRALLDLRQGIGNLILLAGQAGTGKTRLVEEMLKAARGLHIARGQGSEFSRDAAFSTLLRPLNTWLLEDLAPRQVLDRLGIATAGTLAQIIPALTSRIPSLPMPHPLPGDEARMQLVQAVVAALRSAGKPPGAPAILFLDDLHFADSQSLLVLNEILPHLSGTPLLVIGAYRPEEVADDSPLANWLRGLEQHKVRPFELRPLTRADVRALVSPRHPDEVLCACLWERSRGLPLLLVELLRGLQERGQVAFDTVLGDWHTLTGVLKAEDVPLTLDAEAAILQRFGRLSSTGRSLVQAAAVLNREVPFEVLAAVANVAEEPALAGLEEVLERGYLTQRDDDWYRIDQSLTGEVIYKALLSTRRRHLHRRAAQALEQDASGQLGPAQLAELAFHYEQAGNRVRQREYLHKAASAAREGSSHETAVKYYRELLILLEGEQAAQRLEVYHPLAETLRWQGCYSDAIEIYDIMRKEAEAAGDLVMHARAWNGLSLVQTYKGEAQGALNSAQQAEKLARAAGPAGRSELAQAMVSRGWILFRSGQQEDAAATVARQAMLLARDANDDNVLLSCLNLLGSIEEALGRYTEAAEYFEQALVQAQERDDHATAARALIKLGENSYRRADYDTARDYFRAAVHLARKLANLAAEAQSLIGLGATLIGLGELETAEKDLRLALKISSQAKLPFTVPEAYLNFATAYLNRTGSENLPTFGAEA